MNKVPNLTARMYYTIKDLVDGTNNARLDYAQKAVLTFDNGIVMRIALDTEGHTLNITLSE